MDLSEYLDPADRIVPSLPFYNNVPGGGKAGSAVNSWENDANALGRISEGEDPSKSNREYNMEVYSLCCSLTLLTKCSRGTRFGPTVSISRMTRDKSDMSSFHERLNPHVAVLDAQRELRIGSSS